MVCTSRAPHRYFDNSGDCDQIVGLLCDLLGWNNDESLSESYYLHGLTAGEVFEESSETHGQRIFRPREISEILDLQATRAKNKISVSSSPNLKGKRNRRTISKPDGVAFSKSSTETKANDIISESRKSMKRRKRKVDINVSMEADSSACVLTESKNATKNGNNTAIQYRKLPGCYIGTDCGATTTKVSGCWEDGRPITEKLLQSDTNASDGTATVISGWVLSVERFLSTHGLEWEQVL